jgi:hypothetical protein
VAALGEHPLHVVGNDLGADRPGRELADLAQDVVVRAADPRVEAGVRGDAVYHAPADGGPDLIDVGSVEKELHVGRLHVMFVAMSLRRLVVGERFRAYLPGPATA